MPRALITGITGQDGLYLGEFLAGKGYEVFGMVRGQSNPKIPTVEEIIPSIQLVEGDLRDLSSLIGVLETAQPDEIYNLGAISFVGSLLNNPSLPATLQRWASCACLRPFVFTGRVSMDAVRFYQASSSEMFGRVREVPQTEETPFYPRSPYGVAKAYGHFITVNYRESFGLFATSGILFNHESPRRGLEFVTRKVTHGVAKIRAGSPRRCASATSTRSATGASRATTSRRCGGCSSRTSPTTTS